MGARARNRSRGIREQPQPTAVAGADDGGKVAPILRLYINQLIISAVCLINYIDDGMTAVAEQCAAVAGPTRCLDAVWCTVSLIDI